MNSKNIVVLGESVCIVTKMVTDAKTKKDFWQNQKNLQKVYKLDTSPLVWTMTKNLGVSYEAVR